jgi:hypothetical protein
VYAHLDEEKEHDASTWELDTRVTNHMLGAGQHSRNLTWWCPAPCFSATTHGANRGWGTIMFMCKNDESRSLKGVYFIPRLATNIMSIGQLNEAINKIDIDTSLMKIQEPGGLLLLRVKHEANRLYLLHIKLTQPTCFTMCGRCDEVA